SRERRCDARQLRLGGQGRRHRADSDRRGDPVDAAAGAGNPMTAMAETHRTQKTSRTPRLRQVLVFSFVSVVSFVSSAPQAHAQMAGTPAAGYRREAGTPSSRLPTALREIGFDQHLDER